MYCSKCDKDDSETKCMSMKKKDKPCMVIQTTCKCCGNILDVQIEEGGE